MNEMVGCPQCSKPLEDKGTKFVCANCGYVRDWDLHQLRKPGRNHKEETKMEEQPQPAAPVEAPAEPEAEEAAPEEQPVEEEKPEEPVVDAEESKE